MSVFGHVRYVVCLLCCFALYCLKQVVMCPPAQPLATNVRVHRRHVSAPECAKPQPRPQDAQLHNAASREPIIDKPQNPRAVIGQTPMMPYQEGFQAPRRLFCVYISSHQPIATLCPQDASIGQVSRLHPRLRQLIPLSLISSRHSRLICPSIWLSRPNRSCRRGELYSK